MNGTEINKILAALLATYPNFLINEVSTEMWLQVLDGVTYSEALNATVRFMRTPSAFAPTPGQILEMVKEIRHLNQPKYKEIEIPRNSFKGNLRDMLTPEGLKKLMALYEGKS